MRLSPVVGDTGRVYAGDIDEKRLERLRKRVGEAHLDNIVIVKGDADDPHLPAVQLDVVVISIGNPEAVANGEAMLTQPTSHVKLRGKVADMPEQLEVDVSQLGIGDTVSAHNLVLPAGVDLLSAPDATLYDHAHQLATPVG